MSGACRQPRSLCISELISSGSHTASTNPMRLARWASITSPLMINASHSSRGTRS